MDKKTPSPYNCSVVRGTKRTPTDKKVSSPYNCGVIRDMKRYPLETAIINKQMRARQAMGLKNRPY